MPEQPIPATIPAATRFERTLVAIERVGNADRKYKGPYVGRQATVGELYPANPGARYPLRAVFQR